MWLKKSLIASILVSGSAYATCPPILPCKMTGEAQTIAGSNADTELIKFAEEITTSTNQVAQSIIDSAKANSSALQQATQSVVSTEAELSQIRLKQDLQLKQALNDKHMAHQVEIAESQYRANAAVVAADDTKEEFQVIIDHLKDHADLSVPEIVQVLKMAYDDNEAEGKVLVPIKVAEGACSEEDITKDGLCARPKRIMPASKLQALFKRCTLDKRILLEKEAEKESRVAAIQETDAKISEAMNSTNSVNASSNRIESQRPLSCSPTEFRNKLCATDKTVAQYQEAIVIGDIVPNGDVSASNFSRPSISSAEGYIDDLSESTREEVKQQSLNRKPLQENPTQKVIPFTYTYRNANQVKAAMNFVDNLMADELVPALDPNARRQLQNAEYQARHIGRVAALSMARLTLMDSMSQRLGDTMREMVKSGAINSAEKFTISVDSPANKESVLGNSPLDLLAARVEQTSSSLRPAGDDGESTNAGNDFVTSSSQGDLTEKMTESLALQNEMLLKEILMNEQMLSMEAISLAQKANSKQVVDLMTDLRKGR